MSYVAKEERYDDLSYNRCGNSGLLLPPISIGLWHNFGHVDLINNSEELVLEAFDMGITHFDLANNYGPPPGSSEENFGKILSNNLKSYRNEIVISTKAGNSMWQGPYGDWGSKKYMLASLEESLKRLNVDYVDIFYSHRPDPETPLEETMGALAQAVRQGKALYVGLANYRDIQFQEAIDILKDMGVHCLVNQSEYSLFNKHVEIDTFDILKKNGVGCVAYNCTEHGLLSDKYLDDNLDTEFLPEGLTAEKIEKVKKLKVIAGDRGQSISQMAISWALKDSTVNSVVLDASKIKQLTDSIECYKKASFTEDELKAIDEILG